MFKRIFRAVSHANLFVDAQGFLFRGEGERAMNVLNRYYGEFSADMPSRSVPPEVNLLTSMAAIQTNNGPLALACAQVALAQLEVDKKFYKKADQKYLINFSKAVINYCNLWRYGDSFNKISLDLNAITEKSVSSHLRGKFPMLSDGSFKS